MMKINILILLSIFTSLAYASENQAGFVDISDGTGYIYFPRLQPLTKSIFIQWEDAHEQTRCCFKLDHKDLERINDIKTLIDEKSIIIHNWRAADPSSFIAYRFKAELPSSPFRFVGIAIAADKVKARSPNLVLGQTNGKQLTARLCYGQEGVNLISKEGNKYEILYYKFGSEIDVNPKCNARDARIFNSIKLYSDGY
jgi:hypothetical protein